MLLQQPLPVPTDDLVRIFQDDLTMPAPRPRHVDLCMAAAGMTEEELLRETVAVFGGRRLTAGISTHVAEALDVAVSAGRLRQAGSGVYSAT